MQHYLVIFGVLFVLFGMATILLPTIFAGRPLITSWNIFLLGSINFVGISAVQSGLADSHQYSVPNDEDYLRFVLGATTFYVVACLTYFRFKFPRKAAAATLNRTFPQSSSALIPLSLVCAALALGPFIYPNVQFIGQIVILAGLYGGVFGIVFIMACWLARPFNALLLLILIGLFGFCGIVTSSGYGRRDTMSVLLALPITIYWLRLRFRSVLSTFFLAAVFGGLILGVLAGLSAVRGSGDDSGTVGGAASKLVSALLNVDFNLGLSLVGGDTTDASLAAIQLYTNTLDPEPFFYFRYLLVHPIPRAWYPEKVSALGITLPDDLRLRFFSESFSLGPGIVGHGYHEGGLLMLAFYAFFFASIFRYFDEQLERKAGNVVIIGIFAAASGQIFAFSRGDICVFSVLIIACIFLGLTINFVGRCFFGTYLWQISNERADLNNSNVPTELEI